MNIQLTIEGADPEQIIRYQRIIYALIKVGGLDGVKRGRTVIHFDSAGKFAGVQLDYFPWTEKDLT